MKYNTLYGQRLWPSLSIVYKSVAKCQYVNDLFVINESSKSTKGISTCSAAV